LDVEVAEERELVDGMTPAAKDEFADRSERRRPRSNRNIGSSIEGMID
jgi:hypothetical protein